MNPFYQANRKWSDQYTPTIKKIAGGAVGAFVSALLIVTSSFYQDTAEACDMIIPAHSPVDIACRIRRPGNLQYKKEFTLRYYVPSGERTEFDKIMDGYGDYMFYGHAGDKNNIPWWWVLDLHSFRHQLQEDILFHHNKIIWGKKPNVDGSWFAWFAIPSFDPSLVISSGSYSL